MKKNNQKRFLLKKLLNKNIIAVVGGIIMKKDKILIAQRSNKGDHPLKWEFPGGKVFANENVNQALSRELKEELSIDIKQTYFLTDYIYEYSDLKKIHLYFFKIDDYLGKISNNVHRKITWINLSELKRFDFLDGDVNIIEQIINTDILGFSGKQITL